MRASSSLPRRIGLAAVLAAMAAAATSFGVPVAGAEATDPVDHRGAGTILVTFRTTAGAAGVRAAHAAADGRPTRDMKAIRTQAVRVDDVAAALASYRERADVEWAGRDGVVHAMDDVPDNRFADGTQWNLQDVSRAPGSMNWHPVYEPDTLGAGVVVAVVDTGVGRSDAAPPGGYDGFEHPITGYDFVSNDASPDDGNGHGTHIAGTIAQRTGNATTTEPNSRGSSVAGVAPEARILAVRVLNNDGSGSVSNTSAGIIYAADQGAKVINLSLGGNFSKPLCDAVKYATDRGALVVAASGNESAGGIVPVSYPAACPGALAVGGHQWNGQRGEYSNGSCELAFTGPGGDIGDDPNAGSNRPLADARNGILQESVTTGPVPSYAFFYDSGTSMAAAHAAGAAAVLMAPPYGKSALDAARILRSTARDLGAPGPDPEYGTGALDLGQAAAAVRTGDVPSVRDRIGYWMVASDGGIFSFGDAGFHGSTGALRLNSPIVAMARTPSGAGYWLVAADGGIFNFGDAGFHGSAGNLALKAPIVGMAPTITGKGYWLVARDGGIFAFGDARFWGSTGNLVLNQPIVGMAATRTGSGYWLVARDGGIFAFGDAEFHGSTGNIRLNQPIVGIARTGTGGGYWLVATDGGIFSFGDAANLFHGSTGNIRLNKPIIGMVPTCYGQGYWLVASDGGIFSFGAAPFLGSTGGMTLNQPIVGSTLAVDQRIDQR